jgi:alpha-glucosidase
VAAESGDPHSMLALYRRALRLRRSDPDLATETIELRPAAGGVLAFTRGDRFACWVNVSAEPVTLPPGREVLLASGPLLDGALPTDTAVWLRE